ncbi:response regulator transcription factor [Thermomonas sp. XSG]|uniref:response regulator n=1 Tax=Thermomonas sp. XSG TaxID=2771436 RepID=UPI0016816AFE|nr:response regulator transcription factor [Thermomonas sp. XSG]QNU13839.1 response regulator transcription factor [Thermomonas sp. XSG]
MRLLVVEDDSMIGSALQALLAKDGHAVDWAEDGASASTALRTNTYDLVVLDLGLPRVDGLVVLRDMRARGDTTPVIVATARDAVQARISGLDAGADDYVIKPYDYDELLARIRAQLRRAHGQGRSQYALDDIELDLKHRVARKAGAIVDLTAREWAILEPLVLRPGSVLSREQLEDKLFGWGHEVASNAVEVYVHGIRKKLGQQVVQNIRGLGYKVPECE